MFGTCELVLKSIMAKLKSQKEKDLTELTDRIKSAKSAVLTEYRGTTVKDLDKFRRELKKEGVVSKVYKITLIKKALAAAGIPSEQIDYKTPVILSTATEDETSAARIIKSLSKEIKTLVILEGLLDGKLVDKQMVLALADLPTKDQLRAQFMSVLNGPISAFARVLNARAKKMEEPAPAVEAAVVAA